MVNYGMEFSFRTGTDGEERISACYHISQDFDWTDASSYCQSVSTSADDSMATLPKLINDDFIGRLMTKVTCF